MLDFKDVSTWDLGAIENKIKELKKEQFDLKMQKAAAGLEKPHLMNDLRKSIAKLMTARSEKLRN